MNSKTSNPQRGEIWYVQFDPTIGSEFRKTRPAVVVNEDEMGRTNMRIVVPITNWKSDFEFFPWVIRIPHSRTNGLSKTSGADASQVKAVSIERFETKSGAIKTPELQEIIAGIVL